MDFVIELKRNLTRNWMEKTFALLVSAVFTAGMLTNAHEHVEYQKDALIVREETEQTEEETLIIQDTELIEETLKIQDSGLMEETLKIQNTELVEEGVSEEKERLPIETISTDKLVEISGTETGEVEIIPSVGSSENVSDSVTDPVIDKAEISMETEVVMEEKDIKVNESAKTAKVDQADISQVSVAAPVQEEIPSPFLIDAAGMLYDFLPEYADLSSGYIELPSEKCVGIRRGTFAGCSSYIAEIFIPAGMTQIEEGALTELRSLEWITVEAGNPNYISIEGVLFNSAGTHLLAYPPARVGAYLMPASVVSVSSNAFQNTSLFMIDARGCGLDENCLLNISESCSIIR